MSTVVSTFALRIQKAVVLIKAKTGHEREVSEKLLKIAEVKEVHIITGEWDILVVVETERELVLPSQEKVLEVVMGKITKIRDVKDTNTLIPSFSKFKDEAGRRGYV